MLMPKRFCVSAPTESERGGKRLGALSYLDMIDCVWDYFMYHTVKGILQNDVNRRVDLIPIDICKLIGNSDLVEKIPDKIMSKDERKMQVNVINLPGFCKMCKKYSLPKLR